MRNIEIMKRANELRDKIRELEELEHKYDDIISECNHDVIVVAYQHPWNRKIDAACIFCGYYFWQKEQINNCEKNGSKLIDARKYCEGRTEEIIDRAQAACEEVLLNDINASKEEMAKAIIAELEDKA